VAQLQGQLAQQNQMEQLIARAMAGQKIVIGHNARGQKIILDRKSLPLIDQLLASSIPGMGVASVRGAGSGSVRLADDFGSGDSSSLADDLSSTSDDLGDGGGDDAGAVDWSTDEAISYDDAQVDDTYTGDVLAGDSSNQVQSYQQDVTDSGLAQTESQDASVLEQDDDSSDGSILDDNVSTAVGAFATANNGAGSVNAQINQNVLLSTP
jgi:hypothetical protein